MSFYYYANAPKKPRRYATVGDYSLEAFLNNNLVELKSDLTQKFHYKLNQHINWTPTPKDAGQTPNPEGYGSNNTHYVVPKINAIFGGRTKVDRNPSWETVEEKAREEFDLFTEDETKTRNIDYWRKIKIGEEEYYQGCEVKKTTGCFDKQQPVFIRSSLKQLQALGSIKPLRENQIGPSLYIVGSCDYDKTIGWSITWWFIPIKDVNDFLCFNTSSYVNKTRPTVQNDGWIKPV